MAIYFASDFHLGSPNYEASLIREKRIVKWLNEIQETATALYLVGDIFDFWYEYKTVVPKYYTRILGKLAEMSDSGINIFFFKGNHDMWTFDYLSKEIGIHVIDEEWIGDIDGKKFFIHHGDALGPGDLSYKFIRKVFRSKWAIWIFHRLHPNFGVGLGKFLSNKSRVKSSVKDKIDIPLEDEFQYKFALEHNKKSNCDIYIFGHRHKPRDVRLAEKSRFINLGDWIEYNTYAIYQNNEIILKTYPV